jgi:AcrR family transcriptional regulator
MNIIFTNLSSFIQEAEEKGRITRTFRRLDLEKQQTIILAILDEAAENGPADVNIKQVASRSNVAVGSLYQYFGSRENLLEFTLELVVSQTVALFESYTAELASIPLREGLTAYLGGGIEWGQEQLSMVRLFGQAAYQNAPGLNEKVVRPIATALTGMMRAILLAARERGEIRPEVDLEAATRLLNTLMIALGDAVLFPNLNEYYQLHDVTMSRERILNCFFDFLENSFFVRGN